MSSFTTCKVFTCPLCQFRFHRKYNLLRHQRNCLTVSDDFPCTLCNDRFTRKDSLLRHTRRYHQHMFKCPTCSLQCSTWLSYRRHTSHCNYTVTNETDEKLHKSETTLSSNDANTGGKRSDTFNLASSKTCFATKRTNIRQTQKRGSKIRKNNSKGAVSRPLTTSLKHESQTGGGNIRKSKPSGTISSPASPTPRSSSNGKCTRQSLQGDVREYDYHGQSIDVMYFMINQQDDVINTIEVEIRQKQSVKWNVCVHVRMVKMGEDESKTYHDAYFRSNMQVATQGSDLEQQYAVATKKIAKSLDDYEGENSSLIIEEIVVMKLSVVRFKPFVGSTYVPLPPSLSRKTKSLLNIKNNDDKCFVYCVLAHLFPAPSSSHRDRESHYRPHVDKLNLEGFAFPMTLNQIERFERVNSLSINLFGYEERTVFPIRISEYDEVSDERKIDLLFITESNEEESLIGEERFEQEEIERDDVELLLKRGKQKGHFCLITNLSGLIRKHSTKDRKHFVCRKCLWSYTTHERLEQHKPYCYHKAQRVVMPEPSESVKHFGKRSRAKSQAAPFLIIADFESVLRPEQGNNNTRLNKHVPCGFAYKLVSTEERYSKPVHSYIGKNAAEQFVESILKEYDEIMQIFDNPVPMHLTKRDRIAIDEATHCVLCGGELNKDRVLDHNHLNGKFRHVVHSACNVNFVLPKKVICILHNSERYDTHLILEAAKSFGDRKLTCIPHNSEQFLSFTLDDNLVFLDSFKFLSSSLESLSENLLNKGIDSFVYLKEQYPDNFELLTRKLVFPYEHMSSFETLNETQLPSQDAFYSSLTEQGISNEDYAFANELWNTFNCQTMSDFMRLYVSVDVLLLTDIFQTFRKGCLQDYSLDPCHYYSLPGFSLDAALKLTGVHLDLFTTVDEYNFIEQGIRGGTSMISQRFAEANNVYMSDYDPCKDTSYLMYFDVNSLYATCMLESLPVGNFEFLIPEAYEHIDWSIVSTDQERGYVLEVDLSYPSHLHTAHASFPLAPLHDNIPYSEFSPYLKNLLNQFNVPPNKPSGKKLFCTLKDKHNYVVHFKTLQLYLRLGLKLERVHRVLQFKQSTWLKPFIELNLKNRKLATDACSKDRYKLLSNSCFGRFCMNKRKHKTVQLITQRARLQKYVAKTNFRHIKIFSEDLTAIEMDRTSVKLDQPIAVGFSILEHAKRHIYHFYYEVMQRQYGHERLRLLMTDTDSLLMQLQAPAGETFLDPYEFMKDNMHLFDTSNYPRNHPLHSMVNHKVTGLMKDETNGNILFQFIGLKAKNYSYLIRLPGDQLVEKKTAKGIKRSAIKKSLRHQMFKECLFDQRKFMSSFNLIRSINNSLFTVKSTKVALIPLDNKRYILEDGIHSVPYGFSPET